jgi:MFS family permease
VCIALAVAWRRLPSSSIGKAVLDPWSATLMCVSLSGVILVLSEGENWGWASPATLVIGLFSLALVVVWLARELRLPEPLVQLNLIRHRAVLTADVSTFLVSAAMYLYLPVAIDIVQSPPRDGVGLGQSVLVSGLMLLPMSAVTVVSSMAMAHIARVVGQRAIVPIGSLAFTAAMTFFAFQHDHLWDAFISMSLLGLGCGLTFAAMPRMITSAVSPAVTGHAMALYQVLRGVGMAVGSAVCAVLLAVWTDAGSGLPSVAGYRASLLAGAALCLATAFVSWVLPRGTQLRPSKISIDPLDESALIEAAELGRMT